MKRIFKPTNAIFSGALIATGILVSLVVLFEEEIFNILNTIVRAIL